MRNWCRLVVVMLRPRAVRLFWRDPQRSVFVGRLMVKYLQKEIAGQDRRIAENWQKIEENQRIVGRYTLQ